MEIAINPSLDTSKPRDNFRVAQQVCIPNFLREEVAWSLYQHLATGFSWGLVLCSNGHVLEAPAEVRATCSEFENSEFVETAYTSAKGSFSFLYENAGYVPESSTRRLCEAPPLSWFAEFSTSEAFVNFISDLTGMDLENAADVHATRHGVGHFRMFNDGGDQFDGRFLVASLNLTPHWLIPWGGLLLFRGFTAHIQATHTPRFNTLSVFDLKCSHAISTVAPVAKAIRFNGLAESCMITSELKRPCVQ